MKHLLNEFDESKTAILNPTDTVIKEEGFPLVAVGTFSPSLMEALATWEGIERIGELTSSNGRTPIYKLNHRNKEVAIFKTWVGAPATAGCVEEMIAKGVKSIVLFGSCGVLQHELVDGKIIVPIAAIRDEGTSYHYARASDEITLEKTSIKTMQEVLEELGYSYVLGKTWTTDAFYRETKDKVQRRKEAGAICVEMECSAIAAVTKFRDVKFAQFLYAADNLDAPKWEPRMLEKHQLSQKEELLNIALDIAMRL